MEQIHHSPKYHHHLAVFDCCSIDDLALVVADTDAVVLLVLLRTIGTIGSAAGCFLGRLRR